MGVLYDREVVINAGGLRLATRSTSGAVQPILRVQFKIVRSLKKDPNTADLTIYNLNKDNRALLQEKDIRTTIEAGYADNVSQIFDGVLEFGSSIQQGTDWLTTIQSGDGAKQYKASRINISLKGPIGVGDILREAAKAIGLNLGNSGQKIDEGSLRAGLQEWTNGKVLSGKAEKVFDNIVRSLGYGWSIQDGQVQILGPKEVIDATAIRLSVIQGKTTGLVGSPEPGEKGNVKAKTLLQPDLIPGRKVQIQSREINGFFRVEKATFIGDSFGGDWYTEIEAKPL